MKKKINLKLDEVITIEMIYLIREFKKFERVGIDVAIMVDDKATSYDSSIDRIALLGFHNDGVLNVRGVCSYSDVFDCYYFQILSFSTLPF
jgi:hypothetical protein